MKIYDGKTIKFPIIYFIQAGKDGLIKIGYTSNLKKRISTLQVSSPQKLRVRKTIINQEVALAAVPERVIRITEHNLHKRFKKYNAHGEWFYPSPEILHFIKTYKPRMTYKEIRGQFAETNY